MSKIMLFFLISLLLTGCNDDLGNKENVAVQGETEVSNKDELKEKEDIELNQVKPDSLYIEDSTREAIEDGQYLKLGDSMDFYLQNVNNEKFLYYHIKPVDYITKLEKGNDYDDEQWYENIHFVFEVEGAIETVSVEERGEIKNDFNELIDAKLFLNDTNLGKYFYGTFLEDGSNVKKVSRYESLIKVNGEEIYSCYTSGANGLNEETGVRTCMLSFSYAGPGDYLLAVSDGASGFKNYLIEVE